MVVTMLSCYWLAQVCVDTPRTVCRNSSVLLPELTCTHYKDDRLIFDTEDTEDRDQ